MTAADDQLGAAMRGLPEAPGPYSAWREDGWPLCPCCGDDELYSLAMHATIATIQGCYRCSWRPVANVA